MFKKPEIEDAYSNGIYNERGLLLALSHVVQFLVVVTPVYLAAFLTSINHGPHDARRVTIIIKVSKRS